MTTTTMSTSSSPALRMMRLRPRSAQERSKIRAAYMLLAPFLILFLCLIILPLGFTLYLSLYTEPLIGPVRFVGFDNYVRALTDPVFLAGLGRVLLILFVQVPIMMGLALLLALSVDSGRVRGAKAVRLLVFLPYAVPGVVAALMWGYIYGPDFGPVSQIGRALGFGSINLLAPENVLGSIMNIITWSFVGYNMIVFYAALRSIPPEVIEAADIDGAGAIRIAWSVKLPALRPAILLVTVFSIIGSFQVFAEPSLLQVLAPSSIDSGFTPNLYIYNLAFAFVNNNYAAAVSFLVGAIIVVIAYAVQLTSSRAARR